MVFNSDRKKRNILGYWRVVIHTYIHIHIFYLNTIKFKSTDVLVGSCVIILKILHKIKCVLCRNASLDN